MKIKQFITILILSLVTSLIFIAPIFATDTRELDNKAIALMLESVVEMSFVAGLAGVSCYDVELQAYTSFSELGPDIANKLTDIAYQACILGANKDVVGKEVMIKLIYRSLGVKK